MSASRPKPMTGPYTDGLRRKVTKKILAAQIFYCITVSLTVIFNI